MKRAPFFCALSTASSGSHKPRTELKGIRSPAQHNPLGWKSESTSGALGLDKGEINSIPFPTDRTGPVMCDLFISFSPAALTLAYRFPFLRGAGVGSVLVVRLHSHKENLL